MKLRLRHDRATLLLDSPEERSLPSELAEILEPLGFTSDPRVGGKWRAPGIAYRATLNVLARSGYEVSDEARGYEVLNLETKRQRTPHPHQEEGLRAWIETKRRGVVVLPTGAGKSYLAELAIQSTQRSSLIIAPTIDLMNQWVRILGEAFGEDNVGALGGGFNHITSLTVSTYDSFHIHVERLADRFGLVIFDECHHLPSPAYAQAAKGLLTPFRLGLTATPERADGGEDKLPDLVGPIVYRRDIQDLKGEYLASYEVVRLRAQLTEEEREAYDQARQTYRAFLESQRITMGRDGWARFLTLAARSPKGREAMVAWRTQRKIALQCEGKFHLLEDLLLKHAKDQLICFCADNDTVLRISKTFLIPALTHETPGPERKRILEAFNDGKIKALVTARVLNEGVDLPAARVGVVLAGSATVAEHVQRLGRLLRKSGDKQALLYEVISANTGEESTSERRRAHGAYRGQR